MGRSLGRKRKLDEEIDADTQLAAVKKAIIEEGTTDSDVIRFFRKYLIVYKNDVWLNSATAQTVWCILV